MDFAGTLPITPGDPVPDDPIMQQLESRKVAFDGHSYTDFAYHYILAGEVSPKTIGEIGEAVQAGQASFKIFTTFGGRVPYGHLSPSFRKCPSMAALWPSTLRTMTWLPIWRKS